MNLQTIKDNFNRGRMTFMEIEWLMNTVELLEKENAAMAIKHAEKDILLRNLSKRSIRLKQYWDMAKENLEMAQKLQIAEKEIERLQVVDQAYAALKKAL